MDEKQPHADCYADCSRCILTDEQRQGVRCGYLPVLPNTRALCPGEYPYDLPDRCAGYYINRDDVHDASRAAQWRSDGCLAQYYDQPLNDLVRYAIDASVHESRAVENAIIRRNRDK